MRTLCLVACSWWLLCAPSLASGEEGAGSLVFEDPVLKKSIQVYYYAPQRSAKLLFVMHGHTRNAKYHRDAWQKFGSIHRYLIVAPEFREDAWSANAYHFGGIRTDASEGTRRKVLPKEQWTFSVIERLFDHMREKFRLRGEKYSIVGNSAGGQFVHRMALHLPDARFDKAIATNPATYTSFDDTITWPMGFRKIPISEETIQQALMKNVTLIVGENDTGMEGVPVFPDAMRQGKNRLERALNFGKAVEARCQENGWKCQWRFLIAPKAGHGDPSIRPHIEKELLRRP